MGLRSALSLPSLRWASSESKSKLEEEILKLAELWELLVHQIVRKDFFVLRKTHKTQKQKQVEESVLSFPLRKPGLFQAQELFFRVMKLMNTLDETATYAELVRQKQPSQVEDYYPRLKALAQPIVRLLKAFISRKAAIEDLRYIGAFEVVAYDLKRINKGYHRLITDSFGFLPEILKEEAGRIKQEVDEAFIEVLDVYKVSI